MEAGGGVMYVLTNFGAALDIIFTLENYFKCFSLHRHYSQRNVTSFL